MNVNQELRRKAIEYEKIKLGNNRKKFRPEQCNVTNKKIQELEEKLAKIRKSFEE